MTDHKAEWVLVPRVATEAMLREGCRAWTAGVNHMDALQLRWEAMIAAAPAASEAQAAAEDRILYGTSIMLDGKRIDPRTVQIDPAASEGEDGLAEFTDYFVKNYPGPDTIITDPKWHAPRIYRAAQHAMRSRPAAQVAAEPSCPDCKAPGVLYECVWCSANNYPPQVAATPKHDEGRIAELEAEVERLRHWNESVSVCPKHTADIVSFDGCVLCALDEYDPPTAALATQPAARRVTDEDVDRARVAFLSINNGGLNECLRAALESFAQPAEGVSGG